MNRIFFMMIMAFLDATGVIGYFMFGESSLLSVLCWCPFFIWILGVPVYHIKYKVEWSD